MRNKMILTDSNSRRPTEWYIVAHRDIAMLADSGADSLTLL